MMGKREVGIHGWLNQVGNQESNGSLQTAVDLWKTIPGIDDLTWLPKSVPIWISSLTLITSPVGPASVQATTRARVSVVAEKLGREAFGCGVGWSKRPGHLRGRRTRTLARSTV